MWSRCSALVPMLPTIAFPFEFFGQFNRQWTAECGAPHALRTSRSGVDADWFERQCHINGADPGRGVCTVCVEEMTVNSSIEVPCCHQRLHVTCLARSFSSRGVDCPFCKPVDCRVRQVFSFLASSLFHGCLVELDVPPSNRGTNSLVLPLGFPRPPDDLTLLCCPRSGPPPDFEESADRRMEWSPQQLSNQWDPQWLCLCCGRSMELSQIRNALTSLLPVWC